MELDRREIFRIITAAVTAGVTAGPVLAQEHRHAATAAAKTPTESNLLRLRTRPKSKIAPAVAARNTIASESPWPSAMTLMSVTAAESKSAISCS